MKRKSLIDLGLTSETLFNASVAMSYWQQLGNQEFLMTMTHEVKEQVIAIKSFLKTISDDAEISQQPVAFYKNEKTVKEICEIIEEHNDRLSDILDVMWQYAKSTMKEDKDIS